MSVYKHSLCSDVIVHAEKSAQNAADQKRSYAVQNNSGPKQRLLGDAASGLRSGPELCHTAEILELL